jgi:hypothetical protein
MDRSPVIELQKWGPMETGHATPGDRPRDRAGKRPHAGARRRARTVLANPGVKCSPDLPRGLRRVSESAPINRRRVDRHRRCIRPTRRSPDGWDQIPRWAGGWACTSHPGVLGSIPKREEPGKTGAPCIKVPGSSRVPPRPGWAPDPLMVGIRSPDGLVVGSCTSHPGVLGSIPKRETSTAL